MVPAKAMTITVHFVGGPLNGKVAGCDLETHNYTDRATGAEYVRVTVTDPASGQLKSYFIFRESLYATKPKTNESETHATSTIANSPN